MINTFEKVLLMLDSKGEKEHTKSWSGLIKARHAELKSEYQGLTVNGRERIKYGNLITQAVYLFSYAMSRAYFTEEFLNRHKNDLGESLFGELEKIEVVSFGGGPASELVGLVKYLEDNSNSETVRKIDYHIYDKDIEWEGVAKQIIDNIESEIEISLFYHKLDLADTIKVSKVDLKNTDLIMFSYIISELCALDKKDDIQTNINKILSTMSSGARMLFIESKQTEFSNYFKACKGFYGKEKNDNAVPISIVMKKWPKTFKKYINLIIEPSLGSDSILSKWYVKS